MHELMDWSGLNTFVGVARCGSFARYARQQARAPSSVSRAVDALEQELGVRLFQRTTRKLAVTEAGERLLLHVQPLLAQLESVPAVARGDAGRAAGLLRIAAPVAFGQLVLAPVLIEFARAYPEVEQQVVLSDEFLNLVDERVDVALRLGKLADSSLVARRLGKLRYAACASPAYLERRGTPRKPDELVHHDCLRFPIVGLRPSWQFRSKTGARIEVTVRGPVAINNGLALRDCALAGLGITLIPRFNVEQELREGTLVELFARYESSASELDAGIWLVLPSRAQVPPKVRAFTEFVDTRLRTARLLRR
jgi:DNA-binding transcriptional LysR family regulator